MFVSPSRYANFPYALLEAMAAGRPVVFTERNGAGEMLAGSEAGLAVPPDDPAALADAVRPFLADAAAAAAAGEAGRRLVAECCDPDRVAGEREDVYVRAARP